MKPRETAWSRQYRARRGAEIRIIRRASYYVSMAVRRGLLPNPSDSFCVDCGGLARIYDHRFYTRPLEVEPVCISCNKKRGEAWDLEILRLDIQ